MKRHFSEFLKHPHYHNYNLITDIVVALPCIIRSLKKLFLHMFRQKFNRMSRDKFYKKLYTSKSHFYTHYNIIFDIDDAAVNESRRR